MNKRMLGLVVLAACLTVGLAPAFGAIAGTKHDFTAAPVSASEICVACHTPHNGDTSVSDAPLWNHDVSVAAYTVYDSGTLDATDVTQPAGRSLLCLSCHDGTVAIDSFGEATGINFVTGDALLGTDLSNDHPISFTYDTALATADGELKDPSTTASGLGGTIAVDMLFTNKMECASCHDVHDNTIAPFLRKDNAGSVLCLTCHDK